MVLIGHKAHQCRMSVDYLLHESSVGYAVFQVVHQADTVGNRLKEVQDSVQASSRLILAYLIPQLNLQ